MKRVKKTINFGEALQKGLKAAEDAKIARQEIESVFNKLHDDVFNASEGKIRINRVRQEERSVVADLIDISAIHSEWVLIAHRDGLDGQRVEDIAMWSSNDHGYPCSITWNHTEYICEDQKALEGVLMELLEDASTGRKLKCLMDK
jgi:hypothetical protein